jgi:hypothetical protein
LLREPSIPHVYQLSQYLGGIIIPFFKYWLELPLPCKNGLPMKSKTIENIVVDEVHDRTYVVIANRILTDGELYRAIRVELIKRANPLEKGERLVITASNN